MPPESPSPFTANSASTSTASTVSTPLVQSTIAETQAASTVELKKYGLAKPKRVVIRGKITRK